MKAEKRIRTGSFFTPSIWVKKSQQYILKTLGKNWQKDYYVWDCASGTGNLLEGLDNYKKVFASTLEAGEVETIRERFDIPENNAFQFDFLNDSFDNLPLDLQEIIKDPIKSSKLLIYINPPYGQPSDKSLINSNARGSAKKGMVDTKVRDEFFDKVGVGVNQLYVQFFLRIYKYIPNCKLACFTGVKYLNSKSFIGFRNYFKAKFLDGFVVPSDTFYNVKGKFPIGFLMWDLSIKEKMKKVALDVFDKEGKRIVGRELDKLIKGTDQYISKGNDKKGYSAENNKSINEWVDKFDYKGKSIGILQKEISDFQHTHFIFINQKEIKRHYKELNINKQNVLPSCIYLTARVLFNHTWLNSDDQFLYPTKKEYSAKDKDNINKWINQFDYRNKDIGFLKLNSSDFEYNNIIHTTQILSTKKNKNIYINRKNFLPVSIYLTIRHTLKKTWLNNSDHFLYPTKKEYSTESKKSINEWVDKFDYEGENIGFLQKAGNSFQNIKEVFVNQKEIKRHYKAIHINKENVLPACIYLTTSQLFSHTWLNDIDQFTHPTKKEYSAESKKSINEWINIFDYEGESIGFLRLKNFDLQHNKFIQITQKLSTSRYKNIYKENLLPTCIYLTTRQLFRRTWLNDIDHFLYPTKKEYSAKSKKTISDWLREYYDKEGDGIGSLSLGSILMSHNSHVFLSCKPTHGQIKSCIYTIVTPKNLLPTCIYLTTRQLFRRTWLNDIDHFLYPTKKEYSAENNKSIGDWLREYKVEDNNQYIGWIAGTNNNSLQFSKFIYILNDKNQMPYPIGLWINKQNTLPTCIYLTNRHIFNHTWLNDIDQFTHPKTKPLTWKDDKEFQNNCVACTLFHPQNRISAKEGVNHWIPFTEKEVGAKGKFESNFMTNFLNAKLPKDNDGLFECKNDMTPTEPLKFSKEARDVFKAGLEIYKYYHAKDGSNPNYSLHDIRQHFQGFNSKGIMNSKSKDLEYQKLYDNLKDKLEILATKIRPKVYKYGFLDN